MEKITCSYCVQNPTATTTSNVSAFVTLPVSIVVLPTNAHSPSNIETRKNTHEYTSLWVYGYHPLKVQYVWSPCIANRLWYNSYRSTFLCIHISQQTNRQRAVGLFYSSPRTTSLNSLHNQTARSVPKTMHHPCLTYSGIRKYHFSVKWWCRERIKLSATYHTPPLGSVNLDT